MIRTTTAVDATTFFAARLAFQTDVADVHAALATGTPGFVLVDTRSPEHYAQGHLPGAVNLPPEWVDERGPRRIPNRDAEVIVYCSSSTCDSSAEVGARLMELGYRNVLHYAGGKKDWVKAGLPLEGGGVRAT
jgi:rhodanese-related sulfurtransferase